MRKVEIGYINISMILYVALSLNHNFDVSKLWDYWISKQIAYNNLRYLSRLLMILRRRLRPVVVLLLHLRRCCGCAAMRSWLLSHPVCQILPCASRYVIPFTRLAGSRPSPREPLTHCLSEFSWMVYKSSECSSSF